MSQQKRDPEASRTARPAAILDVDGTLVDTNYQHALAWYMAFREHGITVPIWRAHRHIGMGGDQLVPALAGDEVEAELGDDLRTAESVLFRASIQTTSAFDGARALLEELKDRGVPMVLASSANQQEAEHYLDLLDARDLVDGWTTAADVDATKPEPDLILAAMQKIDVQEAVMIGDTPWDVRAAERAGVPTITVLTGGFSEQELMEAGAVAVFESIDELRERLDETPLGGG
ncbi:MAG TPA: HAD family hydrolase [Baekduia sp.]|nr:HAD family hydrolase [Baekduia sp.]